MSGKPHFPGLLAGLFLAYSTETSWDGMNDTTSLDKTVTAVVSATFSLK